MRYVAYSKKASVIPSYSVKSLKEENDIIRKYARENSIKISKFYEDKSDNPRSSTGFDRLREDGMDRRFDTVVLISIYNCGPNLSFARELLLNTFYKAGINFIVIEDGINSADMSADEIKEYFYYARQKANSMFGYQKKSKDLKASNRISKLRIRYGYKLSDDEMDIVIDETAAGVVRRIFEMFDGGMKAENIAIKLNSEGIEPPSPYLFRMYKIQSSSRGKSWNKHICTSIRYKKYYIGCDEDIGYKTIHYPAIVEKEIYDRVNAKFSGATAGKTLHKREDNIFRGKIFYSDTDEVLGSITPNGNYENRFFHKPNSKKALVKYSVVVEEVSIHLLRVKERCRSVEEHLDNGGARELYDKCNKVNEDTWIQLFNSSNVLMNENLALYQRYECGEISKEEYDLAHEIILKKITENSNEFHDTLEVQATLKKSISKKNSWFKLYSSYDCTKPLTRKIVMKMIDKITVDKDGSITVYLYDSEAEVFPEEWRDISGKEKQK